MSNTVNQTTAQGAELPVTGLKFSLPVDAISSIGGVSRDDVEQMISDAGAGDWEQSLEENGWVKFPNGLMVQWGAVDPGQKGVFSVPFPMPFPTRCLNLQGTYFTSDGAGDIGLTRVDSTCFQARIDPSKTVSFSFFWLAIGF